jgi:LPPG:FO 2-phospho-L-lactate transferase
LCSRGFVSAFPVSLDVVLTALAGGVGAARFLRGLVDVVPPDSVTVIVNTGDDDTFHGLHVSPDLDSVTYTLADAQNPNTGWGLAGETFHAIDALERYGRPTWFRLGDRDLATHLFRTERLRTGASLSEVTAEIAEAWGLRSRLLPMTDDPVATRITVEMTGGSTEELAMQDWFVRQHAEPPVVAVRFAGAEDAQPAAGVLDALAAAETILICPSNPVISIGPILAVPGIRDALIAKRDRVVGVSPIIAGHPVKGPADRLMAPLGIEVSCVGVARAYRDFCSALVIDAADAAHAPAVDALGVRAVVADTLMRDARVAAALARETLAAVA